MANNIEERLLRVTRELRKAQIPHAIGGAIALAFYSEPRATSDLYINIFLHPDQKEIVLNTVCSIFNIDDRDAVADSIELFTVQTWTKSTLGDGSSILLVQMTGGLPCWKLSWREKQDSALQQLCRLSRSPAYEVERNAGLRRQRIFNG